MHTLSLTLTLTHNNKSCTLTPIFFFKHTEIHTPTHTPPKPNLHTTNTLTHTHDTRRVCCQPHTHTLYVDVTHSRELVPTHTHTHPLSHTHKLSLTHTHTHTHTLSLIHKL